MIQKDKELLLKDLCARLPYKVKIKFAFNKDIEKINNLIYVSDNEPSYIHNSCMVLTEDNIKYVFNDWFDEYKPYLRPMNSMTEEEFESLKEYSGLKYEQLDLASYQDGTYKCLDFYLSEVPSYVVILVFDWLNKNHFDYRGLIEKGLAIEVTKENNPYKD